MMLRTAFKAQGHPYISSTHRTTLMTTRDRRLSKRGDCIVAVNAEKGLLDLPDDIKEAARSGETVISMKLEVGGEEFTVRGRGHPGLTYTDPSDIVVRKSDYVCGRTIMVEADKAACDIPDGFKRLLKSNGVEVTVTVSFIL
jgi:hypothetical protein